MSTIELTQDNFRSTYEQNDLLFVVFRAGWCGPCKSFQPVYEAVAERNSNIVFGTIDVDAEPRLAEYFSIRSVPFVVIVRGGIELYAEPGAISEAKIIELLEQAKKLDMEEVKKKFMDEEK